MTQILKYRLQIFFDNDFEYVNTISYCSKIWQNNVCMQKLLFSVSRCKFFRFVVVTKILHVFWSDEFFRLLLYTLFLLFFWRVCFIELNNLMNRTQNHSRFLIKSCCMNAKIFLNQTFANFRKQCWIIAKTIIWYFFFVRSIFFTKNLTFRWTIHVRSSLKKIFSTKYMWMIKKSKQKKSIFRK